MAYSNYSNNTIYSIIAAIVNGNKRHLKAIQVPCNNTAVNVVNLFLRNNQICGYSVLKQHGRSVIVVNLRYPDNRPKLFNLKFISRPSRRVYITVSCLREMLLKARSSIFVISSPYGIVSGVDALLLNSGGEIICILN